MSRLVLSAAALALGVLTIRADPASADRRVALVIGNSAYQNAPALLSPNKDAQAIATMFQKAGFDVVNARYDLRNLQFKQAIAQFESQAADSDVAVVYYVGYGIDVQGINYLIPVDAKLAGDGAAKTEAISLDRLSNSVEAARQLRLVILDVCGGNPFPRAALGTVGLAAVEPSTDTLMAYATKAESEGEDCRAGDSPYTAALRRNLFVPGLDIRFAFGRVLEQVLTDTSSRQRPFVYGTLRRSGRISLVPPSPDQPAIDLVGEQIDYSVVEQVVAENPGKAVGTWEVFLVQHPTGFYADAARQQLSLAEANAPALAEQERQARLAEAKKRADAAALAKAQEEAKAAEQAQEAAEREAAVKRDQAEQLAKQESNTGTPQQEAAIQRAQREAQEAAARQQAAATAALAKQQAACKTEQDRLMALEAEGGKAKDDLQQLEQGLTCEQLRPLVVAALERANAVPEADTPEQVRSAQRELARLGCYTGPQDGALNDPTKAAVERYEHERGLTSIGNVDITDDFVAELEKQSARVCPLVCPPGQVAEGERCVAAEKKAVARRHEETEAARPPKTRRASQEERPSSRRQSAPRVTQRVPAGGGHGGVTIGVGF